MALKNQVPEIYSVGINNVGSYQVSGRPWVKTYTGISSGTDTKASFPKVTKSITIINLANVEIHVYFADPDTGFAKSNKHYIVLDSDEDSFTANVRVKEIWVESQGNSSDFTIYAELTNIEASKMYTYDVTSMEGITD